MRRYVTAIMLAVVALSSALAGCGGKTEPVSLPDKPTRTGKEMTYVLHDYFSDTYNFRTYWASPRFLVDEKWSASYNGKGEWLIKAYDVGIDGGYIGSWLVPEQAYFDKDSRSNSKTRPTMRPRNSNIRRVRIQEKGLAFTNVNPMRQEHTIVFN